MIYFFKAGNSWVLGSTSKSFMPTKTYFPKYNGETIDLIPVDYYTRIDPYIGLKVTDIAKNAAGDKYATLDEFITSVKDFFAENPDCLTKNIQGMWRHGFGGSQLNTDYFEVLQTGPGQTVRVGSVKRDGTWTRSTTTATATVVAHGLVTGDLITILYTPDELAIIYSTVLVTVTGTDTFTFSCLNAGVSSGVFSYGQDISNLQLLSGITPNSETVIKSACTFTGTLDMTFGLHMSQRIANCELTVGLYEVSENEVGRPCAISGQIATVTEDAHGHLPGQELQILTSSDASILPTSVRIISTTDNTFTFACVGGVGATATITYFAYNSAIELKFNGTSTTNARFSTFRNVWDAPAPVTVITTAGTPNEYRLQVKRGNISFGDWSANSTTGTSPRGERNKEIPDVLGANFYLFIRLKNLATAPASNTTCTFSFFEVNQNNSEMVEIASAGVSSLMNALPVDLVKAVNISVVPVDTHGGSVTKFINTAGVALTAWAATTTGKISQIVLDLIGRTIMKPFAPSELCWSTVPLANGLVNTTTPLVIKESAGAGLRNYVNNIQLSTGTLGAATELAVRDADISAGSQTISSNTLTTGTHGLSVGDLVHVTASGVTGLTAGQSYYVLTVPSSTTLTLSSTRGGSTLAISGSSVTATLHKVLWAGILGTANAPQNIHFDIPLKGTVATAMSIQTRTAVTGGVYVNVNGHVAP